MGTNITMTNRDKEILKVAQSLGYDAKALHRESMEEAQEFMDKAIKQCPEDKRPFIEYGVQTLINTLTWAIAEKVIKDDEHEESTY